MDFLPLYHVKKPIYREKEDYKIPRNGSGSFSLVSGNPFVTGTTISSTTMNTTLSDIASALTTSIASDGQTTPTANLPMGGFKHTGLGSGSALTDSLTLGQAQSAASQYLTSVSGTDTITASASPVPSAYAAGQVFRFVSAGANTGAVTLNISSLGAKAVTRFGTTALSAGDIPSGAVCEVVYDGTRFQLIGAYLVTTGQLSSTLISGLTEDTAPDKSADYVITYDASGTANKKVKVQNLGLYSGTATSASGTAVDFTGIPDWVKRITILFSALSTNGTSNWSIQIGDSGGVETTGYECAYGYYSNADASSVSTATSGFIFDYRNASVSVHGSITLELLDSATNLWVCNGQTIHYAGTTVSHTTGKKALSATLDRVRITTVGGTNTFDAGTINILYE